jgi:hypothetical protein
MEQYCITLVASWLRFSPAGLSSERPESARKFLQLSAVLGGCVFSAYIWTTPSHQNKSFFLPVPILKLRRLGARPQTLEISRRQVGQLYSINKPSKYPVPQNDNRK